MTKCKGDNMVARAQEPQETEAKISIPGSTRAYSASSFASDLMNYQYCPVDPEEVQAVLNKYPYNTKTEQSRQRLTIGESVTRAAGLSIVVLEAAGVILSPVVIEGQLDENIEDLFDASDGFDSEAKVIEAVEPLKKRARSIRIESSGRRAAVERAAQSYLGLTKEERAEILTQSFRGSKAPLLRAADELQDDRNIVLPEAELIAVQGTLKQLIKSLGSSSPQPRRSTITE